MDETLNKCLERFIYIKLFLICVSKGLITWLHQVSVSVKLSLTTVCGLCVKHFSSGYVFKGNRGIGIPYRQIQLGRLNTQWVTDKRNSDIFSMVSGSWRCWHPRQGTVVYGMLELLLIYQVVHVAQKPLFRRSNLLKIHQVE